jgi:hypothetical protein
VVRDWELKRAPIEAIAMKLRWSLRRRSYDEACGALSAPSIVAEARAFYIEHNAEIVDRMRHPTAGTHNPAATIVLICESDEALRREAFAAQQAAAAARVPSSSLNDALRAYVTDSR